MMRRSWPWSNQCPVTGAMRPPSSLAPSIAASDVTDTPRPLAIAVMKTYGKRNNRLPMIRVTAKPAIVGPIRGPATGGSRPGVSAEPGRDPGVEVGPSDIGRNPIRRRAEPRNRRGGRRRVEPAIDVGIRRKSGYDGDVSISRRLVVVP